MPSTKVELLPVTQHAADMLDHYASFIRADVKADDFERHPYVPEIEETAQALRDLARHHSSHGGEELREAAKMVVADYPAAAGACPSIEGGDGKPGWGSIRRLAEALASSPPVDRAEAGEVPQACPVCHGDCGSANPPVIFCPMRDAASTGQSVDVPDASKLIADMLEAAEKMTVSTVIGWNERERWYAVRDDLQSLSRMLAAQPLEGLTSGEGWKLVPVEPTEAMLASAQEAFPRSAAFVFPKLWSAMLAASPSNHAGSVGETFRPMESWDERDETVLLLVDYRGDGDHPLEDANFAITVGHNNDHNVGEGEGSGWHFAGWCWSHDHYVEGEGKPVGWMPLPHILARAYEAFVDEPLAALHPIDSRKDGQ